MKALVFEEVKKVAGDVAEKAKAEVDAATKDFQAQAEAAQKRVSAMADEVSKQVQGAVQKAQDLYVYRTAWRPVTPCWRRCEKNRSQQIVHSPTS